jgi:energy-coupling factor transporter ATP-binding protein EcfA2
VRGKCAYTRDVRIRRIKLDSIRGFAQDKVDLDLGSGGLPQWVVIAGQNGSGKTTLLRAIALAIVGPRDAWTLAQTFGGWINAEATEALVQVLLDVDEGDTYQGQGRPTKQLPVGLHWGEQSRGREPTLMGDVSGMWTDTKRRPDQGPWSDATQGWFLAGYGPFRRLSGHGVDAQRLMSGAPKLSRLATLFREDAALAESLEWIKDLYLRELEGDTDAKTNKELVFELLNDGLLPDASLRAVKFDSDGLWVQRDERAAQLLGQLSDGYRAVVALVLDLLRSLARTFGAVRFARGADKGGVCVEHSGTVLIDEIDAHLHVSWQRRIGPWLVEHFPHIQFIVTTHSPFICQTASDGGLILLPAASSDERARIAGDELTRTVKNGTIDDALLSALFGLESTRSIRTAAMVDEIKRIERLVFTGKASKADRTKLEVLKEQLPKNPSSEVAAALDRVATELRKSKAG